MQRRRPGERRVDGGGLNRATGGVPLAVDQAQLITGQHRQAADLARGLGDDAVQDREQVLEDSIGLFRREQALHVRQAQRQARTRVGVKRDRIRRLFVKHEVPTHPAGAKPVHASIQILTVEQQQGLEPRVVGDGGVHLHRRHVLVRARLQLLRAQLAYQFDSGTPLHGRTHRHHVDEYAEHAVGIGNMAGPAGPGGAEQHRALIGVASQQRGPRGLDQAVQRDTVRPRPALHRFGCLRIQASFHHPLARCGQRAAGRERRGLLDTDQLVPPVGDRLLRFEAVQPVDEPRIAWA